MMRKNSILLVMFLVILFCCSGCGGVGTKTFSEWTDNEFFKKIPALDVEGMTVSDAVDYGDDNYVITVSGTKTEDYKNYISILEKKGYQKYVDNGEGFDGAVFSSTFTKDKLTVTVVHMNNMNKTYVTVGEDEVLSEHLIYKEEYLANNKPDAKTTMHVPELYHFGSSFIFQLKNGHFIVNDGGTHYDTPYLLDYLEKLTDDGEKPVIEAWIISHAHYDHSRVLAPIVTETGYADRIFVEGFYYNEPSQEVNKLENTTSEIQYIKGAANKLKTSTGETPSIYRLHTGQRYYFNDVIMDVCLSQEQILLKDYDDGFNETSTWLMYTVEGQKILIGGDSGAAGMKVMMQAYSKEYLAVNFFSGLHHGWNTRGDFTSYCKVSDVVIHTYRGFPGGSQNDKLKKQAKETYDYGDGTKIFAFPYVEGTVEILPHNEWLYHAGQERPFM